MQTEKNKRSTLTDKLLKSSLLTLLGKYPMKRISIGDICRSAGIGRTTFYSHYSSAEELAEALIADIARDAGEVSTKCADRDRDYIYDRMLAVVRYIDDRKKEVSELLKTNPDVFLTICNRICSTAAENTENAYLQAFIVFGTTGAVTRYANEGCRESAENMAHTLASYILRLTKPDHSARS